MPILHLPYIMYVKQPEEILVLALLTVYPASKVRSLHSGLWVVFPAPAIFPLSPLIPPTE